MIVEWLKRQSLIHSGFRSERIRRQINTPVFIQWLNSSKIAKALILLTAWAITVKIGLWQSSFKQEQVVTFSILLFGFVILMPYLMLPRVWKSNTIVVMTMTCFLLNLALDKSLSVVLEHLKLFETTLTDLLVPSALGPMLGTILLGPSLGIFLTILISLANGIFLSSSASVLLSSMITGLTGVLFTRRVRRRADLLMAGVAVGFTGLICALVLRGITTSWRQALIECIWAALLGLMTAFIVTSILPFFEWVFKRITDISWLELTDLNHPLLKRLTMEAPGTYHHSLMVGNLAETAAEAIGANPTMCRVLSYFHDIGKLTKPTYFIENIWGERNPHNDLSPYMSALIIISHVKEGVDLAIKHRLPRPIIDVIQQHHGTSLVYYFYRKALQQQQDIQLGGEILDVPIDHMPEIEKSNFQYPGPIPQFRECAIVHLADTIESTSRNLKHPTPQSIENLVWDIIDKRINDGQLNDSGLTLNEIHKIGERFIFTLKNMLHARIEYPAECKDERKDKE